MFAFYQAARQKQMGVRKEIRAFLFVFPTLVVYSLFVLYPVLKTLGLSFYDWDGVSRLRTFVGLGNYLELFFHDPIFRVALRNNILWVLITLFVPMVLGLILASVLAGQVKGKLLLAAVFFVPVTVAPIAAGIAWEMIYHPSVGLLNQVLGGVGLGRSAIAWLGNPRWALYALVQIGNWTYYGFCLLVFFNAIQLLDRQLYDAAKIDGANRMQLFWHVTIPLLQNSVTFIIVYSIIAALKAFAIVFVLTGGGPYHRTELMATYLYSVMFVEQRIGYGASIAATLAVLAFIASFVVFRIREREATQ